MISDLDGELEKIVLHDLRDHTFYAKLVLRRDSELIELDSRPSDAIALAVAAKRPIYCDESVLDEVGTVPDE